MFPLSDGALVRLNKDGTHGETITSNKPTMVFGNLVLHDHYIKDVDPAKEICCEISTDEYGRINIVNKSADEIFVNGKSVTSGRPLFNNSIIKICDGVEFKWLHKQAKENIGAELNDADFASWSDPAKKHIKLSRLTKQRPKGRLTAHPINQYSTACEDIAEDERPLSDGEQNSDPIEIPSTTSENVQSTTNETHQTEVSQDKTEHTPTPNDGVPATGASLALINFSIVESQIGSSDDANNVDVKPNVSLNKTAATSENLMNFTITEEQNVGAVKSQPSNCSVITLSSEESQITSTQEDLNKSIGLDDDEDFFEKSIRSPPTELPDDLFDSSAAEKEENSTAAVENIPSKYAAEQECHDVSVKVESTTENSRHSLIANDASRVDESFEQLVSNDNDDGDDEVIPATQDVLSQQSVDDLDNSSSIIDCDKTEFSFDSNVTNTILTAIKQRPSMDQSQPNMTVVSISSDEGQETLTTDQIKEDTVVLNSEDLFAEECDEQQDIVEVKAEQSSIVIAAENVHEVEKSICEQLNTDLSDSQRLFSQSLIDGFNESAKEISTQSVNNSACAPEASEDIEAVATQETPVDAMESTLCNNQIEDAMLSFKQTETDAETKDENEENNSQDLASVNSESEIETESEEQMDELKFSSSESAIDSNDSGNITANTSCAIENAKASDNEMLHQSNTTASSSEDTPMTEIQATQTQMEPIDSISNLIPTGSENETTNVSENDLPEFEHDKVAEPEMSINEIDQPMTQDENTTIANEPNEEKQSTEEDEQEGDIANEQTDSDESCAIKTPLKFVPSIECGSSRTPNKQMAPEKATPQKLNVTLTPCKFTTPFKNADQQIASSAIQTPRIVSVVNTPVCEKSQVQVISTDETKENLDESTQMESTHIESVKIEEIKTEMVEQDGDVSAAPGSPENDKSIAECDSTELQSADSTKQNPEIESSTLDCTPTKLEVSSALINDQTEDIESKDPADNIEELEDASKAVDQVEVSENATKNAQENEDVEIITTPAKVGKIVEKPSTITRSSRRKMQDTTEIVKCTPRKLDASLALTTSNEAETITDQVSILEKSALHEDVVQLSMIETTVDQQSVHEQNTGVCDDKNTTTSPAETIAIESAPVESAAMTTTVEAEIEQNATQNNQNVTVLLTPAKTDTIIECNSAIARSTRRARANVNGEESTPKKLNISCAPATPFMPKMLSTPMKIVEDTESNDSEIVPVKSESDDNQLPEQVDDTAILTPAKAKPIVEHASVTRSSRRTKAIQEADVKSFMVTPKKLSVTFGADTPCKSEAVASDLEACIEQNVVDVNIDEVKSSNTVQSPSTVVDSNKEQIESVDTEPAQGDRDVAPVFTPIKTEAIPKCVGASGSALTRSVMRRQVAIASPAVRRTPRRLNMSTTVGEICNLETPSSTTINQNESVASNFEQIEQVGGIEHSEVPAVENEMAFEATTDELATNIDIATPIKVNSTIECSSSISRSTRRKQLNIGTPVAKLTPRKLSVSLASVTPSKSEFVDEIAEDKPEVDDVWTDDKNGTFTIAGENECESLQLIPEESTNEEMLKVEPEPEPEQSHNDAAELPAECSAIETQSQSISEVIPEVKTSTDAELNESSSSATISSSEPVQSTEIPDPALDKTAQKIDDAVADAVVSTDVEIENEPRPDVVATPVKTERISSECGTSIIRSTRKQKLVKEGIEAIVTPQKLHMNVSSLITPCKLDSPVVKDEIQESTESAVVHEDATEMSAIETTQSNDVLAEVSSQVELNATQNEADDETTSENSNEIELQPKVESAPIETTEPEDNDVSSLQSSVLIAMFSTPAKIESKSMNEMPKSITRSIRRNARTLNTESAPCTPIKPQNEEPSQQNEPIVPATSNNDENVPNDIAQSEIDIVVSTPAKIASKSTDVESSAVKRSARRKRPDLEVETPVNKRTPRKMNNSIAATPVKSETPVSTMKVDKQSTQVVDEDQPQESIQSTTSIEQEQTDDNVIEPSESPVLAETSQIQQQSPAKTEIVPDHVQETNACEMNVTIIDDKVDMMDAKIEIETIENATNDIFTPAKSATNVPEEKSGSSVARSSKRKRMNLNVETPIANRSLRRLAIEQAHVTPSTSSVQIQEETELLVDEEKVSLDTNEPAATESVGADLLTPAKIEQPAKLNDSVGSALTRSTRGRQRKSTTPAKQTPVKRTPAKHTPKRLNAAKDTPRLSEAREVEEQREEIPETSDAQMNSKDITESKSAEPEQALDEMSVEQTPAKVQSIAKLDEKQMSNARSTGTRTKRKQTNLTVEKETEMTEETSAVDAVTPASKPTSSALRKRGTRSKAPEQSDEITDAPQNENVASVESAYENPIADKTEQTPKIDLPTTKSRAGKRAGTPLPAIKKRARGLGAKQSEPKVSNDVDQPAKVDSETQSERNKNEIEPIANGGDANVGTEKSLQVKLHQLESPTCAQTSKQKEDKPNEQKASKENDDEIAPAKATRRKRANTHVDATENTPKKTRNRVHFSDSVSNSSRSLRSRTPAPVDEEVTTSNATPKKTRGRKKQIIEQKPDEKPEEKTVQANEAEKEEESKDVQENVEKAAKPKRQTGRKAVSKAKPEEQVESKPKAAPKRKQAKVEETADVDSKSVETIEQVAVVPARRTRKNSQSQSHSKLVTAVETAVKEVEQKQEEIVEPKPKRGRPKKAEIVDDAPAVQPDASEQKSKRGRPKKIDTATETPAVEPETSEPVTKQRKPRAKTASKNEDKTEQKEKPAEAVDEQVETAVEPTKKRAKTRKADVEDEDQQPSTKRSRNTKQTKQVDSSPKETATEKKTTRNKKVVELNDGEPVTKSPISTRTRRHK